MPSLVYFDKFLKNQNDGTSAIYFDTDDIYVALSNTAPTVATDDFFNDITELAAGDGYDAGGKQLTVSPTLDTDNHRWDLDVDDQTWTFTAQKTFRYAIYYKSTGTAATSPLIAYSDLGAQAVTGEFQLNVDGTYLFRFAK